MRSQFYLFCFFIVLFTACGKQYEYQKTIEINNQTWNYADSLVFEFDIKDTLAIYNLYLDIEHHPDYAFQNLYTLIHTYFPAGQHLKENLSLELSNPAGIWMGNCNSNTCQLSIPIQQNAYFNQTGEYRIVIEQFMREEAIDGIQAFTFKVEDTHTLRE